MTTHPAMNVTAALIALAVPATGLALRTSRPFQDAANRICRQANLAYIKEGLKPPPANRLEVAKFLHTSLAISEERLRALRTLTAPKKVQASWAANLRLHAQMDRHIREALAAAIAGTSPAAMSAHLRRAEQASTAFDRVAHRLGLLRRRTGLRHRRSG